MIKKAKRTCPKAGREKDYVRTWEELATKLGISRRTLLNFREREAEEIKRRRKQLIRADGRYVISAWKAFTQERGCDGRGVKPGTDEEEEPEDETRLEGDGLPSKYTLQKRELALKLERQEFELRKEMEAMLEVGFFEHALGVMLSTFRQSMDALPGRCAGMLGELDVRNTARELVRSALTKIRSAKSEDDAMQFAERLIIRLLPEPNYHFRLATILKEVEIVKRTLRGCSFMQPGPITLTEAAQAHADNRAAEGNDGQA